MRFVGHTDPDGSSDRMGLAGVADLDLGNS